MSNKELIIDLRKNGKTYNEISDILGISKSTIHYHCKKLGINGYNISNDTDKINEIKKLCETHTIKEVSNITNVSISTVKRYKNKNIKLTDSEIRNNKIKSVIDWRKRAKDKLIEYKGGECVICGYNKCSRSMDFHHLDPDKKDFGISGSTKSISKLKKEVDKCILVCKNCHGEIHDDIENKKNEILNIEKNKLKDFFQKK